MCLATMSSKLRIAAREHGVHLLDNSAVEIGGVRFLGAFGRDTQTSPTDLLTSRCPVALPQIWRIYSERWICGCMGTRTIVWITR